MKRAIIGAIGGLALLAGMFYIGRGTKPQTNYDIGIYRVNRQAYMVRVKDEKGNSVEVTDRHSDLDSAVVGSDLNMRMSNFREHNPNVQIDVRDID